MFQKIILLPPKRYRSWSSRRLPLSWFLIFGLQRIFYHCYERQGPWTGLSWLSFPSSICRVPCGAVSFLDSHSQPCRLFLHVINFYSSETTLGKFYTVNVDIRGNDLSYDGCKKVQERPYSTFPAKEWKHDSKNCHRSCFSCLKNGKHLWEKSKGK